jgi:hypothetical protein
MKRYKRLAEAILERAIIDLLKPIAEDKKRTLEWVTSYHWIFNSEWPSILKFESCCDALDINPEEMRRMLQRACDDRIMAMEILYRSKKMDNGKGSSDQATALE